MRKNRYLLCLLMALAMIYYDGPRLPLDFNEAGGKFTLAWTSFALLVISGNLTGLLRKTSTARTINPVKKSQKRKAHSRQH